MRILNLYPHNKTYSAESAMLRNILRNSKKAVLLGIGGGGDVVGTIPTADLFKTNGIKCVLGGLSWDKVVNRS